MVNKTVTRAELFDAVQDEIGLSRAEAANIVETVLSEITETLVNGETVKLSSFGTFGVRHKNSRVGRNPKTGEEVTIEPRRVVYFRPSHVLRGGVNTGAGDGDE
ncbi:MAG: integration host factor subunit alpha [Alphaproteobacteria bacterium]